MPVSGYTIFVFFWVLKFLVCKKLTVLHINRHNCGVKKGAKLRAFFGVIFYVFFKTCCFQGGHFCESTIFVKNWVFANFTPWFLGVGCLFQCMCTLAKWPVFGCFFHMFFTEGWGFSGWVSKFVCFFLLQD